MERVKEIIKGDMLFHLFHMELLEASEGYARLKAKVKVVEFKAESENTKKLLAKGMATALPFPRK